MVRLVVLSRKLLPLFVCPLHFLSAAFGLSLLFWLVVSWSEQALMFVAVSVALSCGGSSSSCWGGGCSDSSSWGGGSSD